MDEVVEIIGLTENPLTILSSSIGSFFSGLVDSINNLNNNNRRDMVLEELRTISFLGGIQFGVIYIFMVIILLCRLIKRNIY